MKKRHFLIGAVASALLGLGSCELASRVPNASPISAWDETGGMQDWNEWMKDEFPNLATPEWCVSKEEFFGDVYYVRCYSPIKKAGNKHFFNVAYCRVDVDISSRTCNPETSRAILTDYEAGKYKRFLGSEELLPEEKLSMNLKNGLLQLGFVLFFLVPPVLVIIFLIVGVIQSITTKKNQN